MDSDRSHILIVEDDPSARGYFSEVLRQAGYATTAVGTIAEATAVLEAGTPEIICVLLDGHLPDGHGIDLLQAVRDDAGTETLPVLIVSGDVTARAEIAGLDAGATDYLFKPVSPEALAARVAAHLRDRAAWLATLDAVRRGEPAHRPIADPERGRERVGRVIRAGAFTPVYQPIVELQSQTTVAFEALTRFDDGTPPDRWLHEAAEVGRSIDLELATLRSAVNQSSHLPHADFVSLNVSPGLLRLAANELGELVEGADRRLVLEITEREAITDYAWIRTIVHGLGPTVGLSIDDTGAGFASLRHVLMLEPDFVKLDRSWVVDIDTEPPKQAMVAGLVHFASVTGCTLIAEGIESHAERQTLVDLGVDLGQGFLLGMPAAAVT